MHVDLDAFYAQCEENANPSLKGKPVVVCVYSGRTEESGVVSTSNYEARKYGVKAGIPIIRAKKLLESVESAFLPMNHSHYEEVSERIMEILRAQSDAFEQTSIDEAFLDLSARTNFDSAEETAIEIKRQLLTFENVTCSIGIAPNKVVAKIASDQSKPKGLTIVRPDEVIEFLSPLPITRIPGVGKKAEEKLNLMSIATIAQLSTLSPTTLIEAFGKSLGGYFYAASRGENDEPVKDRVQPTQLSRIATLKQNATQPEETFPLLDELSKSVSAKLREQGMKCKTVGIIAILTDLSIHNRSKTLETVSSDGKTIETTARGLIKEFMQSDQHITLRRVGVKASNLTKEAGQTDISKFLPT